MGIFQLSQYTGTEKNYFKKDSSVRKLIGSYKSDHRVRADVSARLPDSGLGLGGHCAHFQFSSGPTRRELKLRSQSSWPLE